MYDVNQLKQELEKGTKGDFYSFTVEQQVDSTNRVVQDWAKQGHQSGRVCLALSQTCGRGRLGRSFYSPEGTGIYFSILLRPHSLEGGTLVTTAAAVAMAKAMEQVGKCPMIKWVNDILVDNRKVCGILAQGGIEGTAFGANYVVLGVGVNLTQPTEGFPTELKEVAGGLFDQIPALSPVAALLTAFFNEFLGYYKQLEQKEFWEDYHRRNWLLGKTVTAACVQFTQE